MSGGTGTADQPNERAELGIEGLGPVVMVGSGGSSTVYRARQDALAREVAVKVVHAAWTMETRERFEHERELMGRLSGHTAIVPIFETGITKRGEPYLLMPYYHRGSLYQLMKERGPLPWIEASFLLETMALTLADVHREGIVHRDVKPGNILLTRHLHPRLGDFGIALPCDMATSPATVAYTPSYSPPEAFEPGVAAPTVDVYGLGATLWALLAGRPPPADPPGAGPVEAPQPNTPTALVELVARSMDPEANRRPPDAAAFAAELRRASRHGHAEPSDRTRSGGVSGDDGPTTGGPGVEAPVGHHGPSGAPPVAGIAPEPGRDPIVTSSLQLAAPHDEAPSPRPGSSDPTDHRPGRRAGDGRIALGIIAALVVVGLALMAVGALALLA